ncbi:hypothetical protein ACH5AL_29775 [Actinacidiphila glaucinigra]|uniref:hypothetical protein n=1 Tax=Actinacidiphila glaucinigra TaxID=235986 RepID=UPI0037974FFD
MDGTPHRAHDHRSSRGTVIAIIASASANVGFAVGTVAAAVGELGDTAALSGRTSTVERLGAGGQERAVHRLKDGREVIVLADTKMINLTAAKGNPIQAMDLGLTLQARSLAALTAAAENRLAPGVQAVPAPIDRQVATDLVGLLSA